MMIHKNLLVFPLLYLGILSCSSQQGVSNIPHDYRLRIGQSELTFEQQMYYLAAALEIYRLHTGAYPAQEENLEALLTKPEKLDETAHWFGPYTESEVFFKDPWNNRIVYTKEPESPYRLYSTGQDGVPSSDDIDARTLLPDLYRELDKLVGEGPLLPFMDEGGPNNSN